MAQTVLKVTGMTCNHCVNRVRQAISQVSGVASVKVDLDSGRAEVEGQSLDQAALIKAVEEAGYKAAVSG